MMQFMPPDALIKLALTAAVGCHEGQKRGDGVTPYIAHPLAVFAILRHEAGVGGAQGAPILAAALLHDVMEDCGVQIEALQHDFGAEVAGLVDELTTPATLNGKPLNGPERKIHQLQWAHLLTPPAALVKIADKIANLRDAIDFPKKSWAPAEREAYFEHAQQVVARLDLPPIGQPLRETFTRAHKRLALLKA